MGRLLSAELQAQITPGDSSAIELHVFLAKLRARRLLKAAVSQQYVLTCLVLLRCNKFNLMSRSCQLDAMTKSYVQSFDINLYVFQFFPPKHQT